MKKIEIVYKKVDELIPYENNPRKNDEAVEAVANSIKEFGFKNPIIIDKNNVIVCGHTRLKACKKLGIEEVPTISADDLSEEQINAFRISDNSTAELADWDFEKLNIEYDKIKNIDLTKMGLKPFSLDDIKEDWDDLSDKVNEVYEVVVECDSETEQANVFAMMKERGFKCRVLTL